MLGEQLGGKGLALTRIAQAEARGGAVRDALGRAGVAHFAGHAQHGDDAWSSALLLHGRERLDVADVLVLPRAPRLVALSACEGALETSEAMGIAQAFARRGAEAVVAPVRPIRDRGAAAFWARYYDALFAQDARGASAAARDALRGVMRDAPADLDDALALRVLVP